METERRRLVGLVPHWAHCASCDKLVPESEWAEQAAGGGIAVYHKPDGYRAKGTVMRAATVLFWRPSPEHAQPPTGR